MKKKEVLELAYESLKPQVRRAWEDWQTFKDNKGVRESAWNNWIEWRTKNDELVTMLSEVDENEEMR